MHRFGSGGRPRFSIVCQNRARPLDHGRPFGCQYGGFVVVYDRWRAGPPVDASLSGVDREYAVRVKGQVDDDMIARLKAGVELEDGVAKFTDIQSP